MVLAVAPFGQLTSVRWSSSHLPLLYISEFTMAVAEPAKDLNVAHWSVFRTHIVCMARRRTPGFDESCRTLVSS